METAAAVGVKDRDRLPPVLGGRREAPYKGRFSTAAFSVHGCDNPDAIFHCFLAICHMPYAVCHIALPAYRKPAATYQIP